MKRVLIIMAFICMAFSASAQNKYAVLITGDMAVGSIPLRNQWNGGNNLGAPMQEFWNDTYLMWELLQAKGFSRENIFVLFGDGNDYLSHCPRYRPPLGVTVTDASATISNVNSLFTDFINGTNNRPQISVDDYLFVWIFDHGEYELGHSYFYLMDGMMSDFQFAALLDLIPAHRKTFWMQQCFGGGFADDLSARNTVFTSASTYEQLAWRANDNPFLENESCEGSPCYHGEFDFHMYSVVNGESPSGVNTYGIEPYAWGDINGDGIISMWEAYDWDYRHDSWEIENPVYDDLGNIGKYTSLDYPTLLYDTLSMREVHRGIIGVSKTLYVLEGQTLTFTGKSKVELCNYASIIVEQGGTLVIDGEVEFSGTHNNSLIIYGDFVQNTGTTLTFNDMSVYGYTTSLSVEGAHFNDTELYYRPETTLLLPPMSAPGYLFVKGCVFNNPNKQICISVENSLNYYIRDNIITAASSSGIYLKNCGNSANAVNSILSKCVSGNEIYHCNDGGLVFYASTGHIIMNHIHNNGVGVKLLNNSNVGLFKGDCSATSMIGTQYIHDNSRNEVLMGYGSVPESIRNNAIMNHSDVNNAYIYYCASSVNESLNIDVTLNTWGNDFSPIIHLQSSSPLVTFNYQPEWIFGDCTRNQIEAMEMVLFADSLCEEGQYELAKTIYLSVVENYANTISARTAVKSLFTLETVVDNNYEGLKDYYLNNIAIVSNEELKRLAQTFSNRCDMVLGNYSEAITWFENVITNPETEYADSIFATIDLGDLYLYLEELGEKAVGKLTEFIPKSRELHELQTMRSLSLLPKPLSKDYLDDYENWDEIVTEQPEGYVVDAEGNVEISTPEGLAWLTSVINGLNGCTPDNFDGRTITLMCDLNMSQYGPRNLKPISRRNRPFMGTFDGAGYGLDGLILNFPTINESSNSDMALFGYLLHGTVKNLTINSGFYKYVHAEGTWYDAVLVAVADSLSLVDNCICQMRNIGAMNPAGENYMGGVVGLNRNSTVRNCAYVMGEYDLGFARNGGGIVCRNLSEGGYAPALVVNCFFYGKMIGSYGVRNAGGIVCFNEGDISPDNKGYSAIVSNCYSELLGPLFGLQDQGCIVAYNDKGGIVENCFADLSAQDYVGLFGSDYGFINNCTNFITEGGDGVLEEPVSIGQDETGSMLQALNYWVESQEEFGIYNTWLTGTQIPVPEFGAVYDGIEEAHDNGLKMAVAYPNPGRNTLNIRTALPNAHVEVYDINGKLIHSQALTEHVTAIDASDWAEGVYVWKVMAGTLTGSVTEAESGKWIKE